MREVNVGHKTLADYRSIVPKELMTEIDELAEPLRGRQVLHVNATAFGGGVAEILYTLVPLVSDVGLEAQWQILTAPPEFFNVTKSFHNGLQGHAVDFPPASRDLYEDVCRANAAELTRPYDFVVIHDPQPLAIRDFVSVSQDRSTKWIWRCHIDTSTPDRGLYDYLLPSINRYDAAVYTLARLRARRASPSRCARSPRPSTRWRPRTWSSRPRTPPTSCASSASTWSGPLLLQVSRFDPWKDPLGVVDVYRAVKAKHPDVQLALVGSMASDDPEGWEYLERVIDYVGDDPDVFILSNLDNVGSVEINAFQSHADVVMQKSTREGFGLTVTEAPVEGPARRSAATSAASRCRSRTA